MNQMVIEPAQQAGLKAQYRRVRDHTERLAAALTAEDQCIQSMPDASPAKWHRAHTTWFFEEFVLKLSNSAYTTPDPTFQFLFNSYYEAVGQRQPRFARGMITRPSADAVSAYRQHVDTAIGDLLDTGGADVAVVALGLQHEQQHQELLLTDMLHAFAQNPVPAAVLPGWTEPTTIRGHASFLRVEGGVVATGYDGDGFCFDNEGPRHDVLLRPFLIADRLVRNGEWLDFMADGGYRRSVLWMSDGWATAQAEQWEAPLHWRRTEDGWMQFGLGGQTVIDLAAPVRHISWYEADAFARWSGARLPTEFEFEHAAMTCPLHEVTGFVWQWTDSAYRPYPGFAAQAGALGEYNGKFMINQMVLRGSSLATPPGHARPTYRNFFHPEKRWQFTGLRLAREA